MSLQKHRRNSHASLYVPVGKFPLSPIGVSIGSARPVTAAVLVNKEVKLSCKVQDSQHGEPALTQEDQTAFLSYLQYFSL